MALVRRIGSVGPKSNVPEVSQPWARDLEARLQALEVDTGITKRGIVTARSNTETQATFQTIQQGMIKGVQSDLVQIEIENEMFREEVEQELEESRERLDEAQDELDNLNNVVLPGLDSRLNDMQQEIDDIVVEAGGNTITYSVNAPSSTGGYTEGDTWFQIDGSGNILGQWEFDGDDWQSRQIDNEFIANLDAGKINAGILDAERIGANSITANKLLIGDFENLFNTGPYVAEDESGWEVEGSPSFSEWTGDSVLITPASGVGRLFGGPPVTVRGTEEFYFSFPYVRTSTTGTITLYSRQRNSDGVISNTSRGTFTGSSPGELSGTYAVPSNAVSVQFYLHWTEGTAPFELGAPVVRRRMSSTLIEDGAITTGKIAAGSITANDAVFATGAIQSADIGELTADKITSGTLSAIDITGVNIVGSTITGTEIYGSEIVGADITGTNTLTGGSLNVEDGSISVLRTGGPGVSEVETRIQTTSPHILNLVDNVANLIVAPGLLQLGAASTVSLAIGDNPVIPSGFTGYSGFAIGVTREFVGTQGIRMLAPHAQGGGGAATIVDSAYLAWPGSALNVGTSANPSWSPIGTRVHGTRTRTTSQTVSGGTRVVANMTAWKGSPEGVTSASGGMRVSEPGMYAISAIGVFTGAQDSTRVSIYVNGAEVWSQIAPIDGSLRRLYATHMHALEANDLVQMYVNTTGGGSVTLATTSELSVTRVSA